MPTATETKSKKRLLELKREKLKRDHPRLFVAKYHHRNVHGKPMAFGDKYRFLIPLYKGLPSSVVYEKSVQCGVSELMIVSALVEASMGLRILYVMPNIDLRGKFVKDRLDRLLKTIPYYRDLIKYAIGDSTSIGMKHFGEGLLNFVGSNSPGEFISYPADALLIDEVDKCNQRNLEMAPDRLDASDYKFDTRCGNPTVENWGIDAIFKISTQSLWCLRCDCGKRQTLDFFKNVVEQTGENTYELISGTIEDPDLVCTKCGKPIDRLGKGEWVDQFESSKKGYRISQLFSSNVTLASLVDIFFKSIGNEIKTQLFYNSKLGLPYSSSGSKFTYALLQKHTSGYIVSPNSAALAQKERRVHVGVDVGKYYYVIGRARLRDGKRKLVFMGRFTSTKDLIRALEELNAKVIVIDEMPEQREVENMKKTIKRMFSVTYKLGRTLLDIRKRNEEYKKERRFSIDRTFAIDSVKQDFQMGKIINPGNAKDLLNEDMEEYGEYYQHLLSPTRTYNEDRGRFIWTEVSADHLLHAEAYCKLAEELDDRITDYYEDFAEQYKGTDIFELKADVAKEKELVPKDKQELALMRAENFLNILKDKSEDILGPIKTSPKTRAEMDD